MGNSMNSPCPGRGSIPLHQGILFAFRPILNKSYERAAGEDGRRRDEKANEKHSHQPTALSYELALASDRG